ncbi:hypothetical protein GCM10023185_31020 [Hymenobacter saemangeumensis]|uniref:Phage portal protein n=1 Tax=Hymenobacter saemangeumensis TaxID=1084522 RepID=A0ABP8IMG9_9BACT
MAATPRPKFRTPATALIRTGYVPTALPATPEGPAGTIKPEPWGSNNQLPQEILRVVYDSGTAETCLDRLAQFIGGRGFASKDVAGRMANPGQTFNQLLGEMKHYAALGLGVVLFIRFTFGGEVGEVYCGQTDCVRREKGGPRFILNLKLAQGKMPAAENRIYLPYDPQASAAEISEQVVAAVGSEEGYWGHCWHVFEKRPGRELYPVPHFWASKEDLESDAALPRYDRKQIKNGFFPDAVLTLVGKKYDDVPAQPGWQPGEGQTADDEPYMESPDLTAIKTQLKELKGAESEASILLNVVESETEKPQIDWVDKGPNSKGLSDMTARIEGKVYRRFGVPPVLCGVSEPGLLGNNQQIVNSIKLFNLVVEPRRVLITHALGHLFPSLDFGVTPLNPVEYIDQAVVAKMTDDELRAVQGLPPLEKPQDTQAEKTLKALNGMSPLVATKVLEELTSAEIRSLAGLAPITVQTPRPKAQKPAAK